MSTLFTKYSVKIFSILKWNTVIVCFHYILRRILNSAGGEKLKMSNIITNLIIRMVEYTEYFEKTSQLLSFFRLMSVQTIALIESQRQYIFLSSIPFLLILHHACLSSFCINIFSYYQIETRVDAKKRIS